MNNRLTFKFRTVCTFQLLYDYRPLFIHSFSKNDYEIQVMIMSTICMLMLSVSVLHAQLYYFSRSVDTGSVTDLS